MSDPIIIQTWEAIATQIEQDYSAGYSGLDLTDRVRKEKYQRSPEPDSVYVVFVDQEQQNGNALTRYKGSMVFQIYCFASGGSIYDRIKKAIQLGADCHNSILADRTLGLTAGRIDNLILKVASYAGEKFGFNTMGICVIQVEVEFQSDRGL